MTIRVPSLYLAGVAFVAGVGCAGLLMSPPARDAPPTKTAEPANPPPAPVARVASAADDACKDAAWPYTSARCAPKGERPARHVRVIQAGPAPVPPLELAEAAAPASPSATIASAPRPPQAPAVGTSPPREVAPTGPVLPSSTAAGPPAPAAMVTAALQGRPSEAPRAEPPASKPAPTEGTTRAAAATPVPVVASTASATVAMIAPAAPILSRIADAPSAAAPVSAPSASLVPSGNKPSEAVATAAAPSVAILLPDPSGIATVRPASAETPAQFAAAAPPVEPVPPEGARPADGSLSAVRRVALAEQASGAAPLAERIAVVASLAERREPASPPARSLAAEAPSAPAITPPLREIVAGAPSRSGASAAAVPERQEARAEPDPPRKLSARERVAARAERPGVRRAEARRSREAGERAGRTDRVAQAPSGRPLQLLRLRVYDYPDGTRIAVNPRTGETYTGGSSARRAPSRSVMGWLAGDPD